MSPPMPDSLDELQDRLVTKAMRDDAFGQRLLARPEETIQSEFGVVLPRGFKVKILEQDTNTMILVLPKPQTEDLSMDELDAVTGGVSGEMNWMKSTLGK